MPTQVSISTVDTETWTGNTLIDADGGIVLDSMTTPPAPTTFPVYESDRTRTLPDLQPVQ